MENQNLLTKDYDNFLIEFNKKINNPDITKAELLELKTKAQSILLPQYSNLELTVKKDANSLYGTSANEYFSLVDYNVSTDITMAGKHATVMIDRGINNFFKFWADDINIVNKMKEFYPNVIIKNNSNYEEYTKTDLCNYGDTDSRYINLGYIYENLMDNVDIPECDYELADFALFLMDNFIDNLMFDIIKKDCEYRNAYPQYLKMTHEVTTRMCAFMGKKQYIMTLVWKDGKKIDRKLKFTGIELKKGSMSPRLKKLIQILITKFFIDDLKFDVIKKEIIGLFKYIIRKQERSLIYRISTVNDLDVISFNEETGLFISEKNHVQHKIALFWMNFIKNNNPDDIYKAPFEGQKMNFYYDEYGNVVGVPDDVDIDKVKNLPKPDYVKMLKDIFIKNVLKYITELNTKDLDAKTINNFLANVNKVEI